MNLGQTLDRKAYLLNNIKHKQTKNKIKLSQCFSQFLRQYFVIDANKGCVNNKAM